MLRLVPENDDLRLEPEHSMHGPPRVLQRRAHRSNDEHGAAMPCAVLQYSAAYERKAVI